MLQNRCWLISKVVLGLFLIIQTQAAIQESAISTDHIKSADRSKNSDSSLKDKNTQEYTDRIAKLQRDSSRSDRMVLRSRLEAVVDCLNPDGSSESLKEQNIKRIGTSGATLEESVADIKRLCQKLGIDDGGMDWQELTLCLSQEPVTRSSCSATLSKISQILVKVCDIQMNMGSGGSCGQPITQAMLPFTASVAGQSYVVTEPLTHTGGTSAITISATGVTIDMCGHRLATTTMTAPAVQLTGTYATIKNGFVETDGSSDAINIAVAATDATIEDMAFLVTTGDGHVISSLGPVRPYIHNVDINMPNVGTGSAIYFSDPGVTERSAGVHIDGFYISTDFGTLRVSPAIYIQTAFIDTHIKNGFVIWEATLACEGAIVLDDVVDAATDISVQDVYIRQGGSSGLKIYLSSLNTNFYQAIVIKGVVVEASHPNPTILIPNPGIWMKCFGVLIEDCVCEGRSTGFLIENTSHITLINNHAVECFSYGFDLADNNSSCVLENNTSTSSTIAGFRCNGAVVVLKNNKASAGDYGFQLSGLCFDVQYNSVDLVGTAGFSVSGVQEVVLKDNIVIGQPFIFGGSLRGFEIIDSSSVIMKNNIANNCQGFGFNIDALSVNVSVEGNSALKCGIGFNNLAGVAASFSSNKASYNTTNYVGVLNTFSLAAITTETYWYNAAT